MQYQLDLAQRRQPRPRIDRLFFGLLADAETARRVESFRRIFAAAAGADGSRIAAERLHVSIQHVADVPPAGRRLFERKLFAARAAAAAVRLPAFDACFDAIRSFSRPFPATGRRARLPLVLLADDEGLFRLHGALGAGMRAQGLRAGQTFQPHMTLLYGPANVPPRPIAPIRLPVREFMLIHSEVGLSRYHMLGRWRLAG